MSKPLASAAYTQAFKTLNDEQRQAVTTIEGPVLVVAGPGTGKTQILALRVGNILLQTDAAPENILCLTYTEAGTVAMRRRLLEFIGPEAYRVPIHTFHGFCNSVIQENAPYFNQYRELRQADELEVRMLYKDILDELPTDHILRRQKGDVYYDVRNMAGFFSDMKKEDWTPQDVVQWIDKELKDAKTREEFLYKRANKALGKEKGDLNDRIYDKYAENLKKTAAAAELFPVVQERMTANGWYDYQDMILWVLRAFQNDANLLADYQERYQYFLVDEYQDTNGAQNELLDLLCDYWERPNVFVVGDDDQAIYRFQGANIGNIQHFIDRYAPERIVLKSNYRSSQAVLDAAQVLIEENEERLVRQDPTLTKDLVAANDSVKDLGRKPLVVEYQNAHEESAGILEWIERFQKQGTPLHEIAILYRKHKQVEELVRVMEQRGMPMNLRKKVNILQLPLVHQFLELLEYLAGEFEQPFSEERRLFEILHYPYFDIPALDIARLSMHFKMERREARESGQSTRTMYWREAITDEATLRKAGINNTEPFTRFGANIDRWIREQHEFTIQVLFEKILHFGNVYRHIFAQNDRFWLLQVIKTFFDFIKDQTAKRPELSLSGFLRIVENMVAEGISIEFHRVIQSEEGVHFITAHSSKGLEFDVVLLIGSTQKVWDKKPPMRKFTYPPQMTGSSNEASVEDNRRLFFVAMTRAKKDLIISYHLRDTEDKETDQCRFLAEIQNHPDVTAQHTARTEQSLVEGYLQSLIYGQEREVPLIDRDIIARALEGYTMSVTALNKYLECKLSFYFENILSVPSARNVHMGFGSAVHQALFDLFRKRDGKRFPEVDDFLRYFERAMEHFQSHFTGREYEDRMALGHDHLRGYYEHYRAQWDFPLDFFLEKKIQHVHCAGVPITGVLDKVEVYPEHYVVVDYKTGDPKYARDKLLGPDDKNEGRGGDYWRQIVFYQLLMEADPAFTKPMDRGFMDFIQRNGNNDRYVRHAIVVTPEDREIVKEQLVKSFEGIQNHEFLPGCGKEDCYWCNFIRFADYGSVPPELDENSGV
jgi:DNA helicase II / ATP-dependent DNA helicase PcrA